METLGYVVLAVATFAALYLYVAEEMERRRRPRPVALAQDDEAQGGAQVAEAQGGAQGGAPPPTPPTSALIPRGPSWRTNRSRTSEELMRHVFFTATRASRSPYRST